MIAKAGLGLIGLSAVSVGGVALANPGWLGMGENPMPSWHSLSEDNEFNNTYSDANKFGKKYGRYLVGVTHKKGSDPQQTNEGWWKWAFEKMSKDISSSKFSTKGPDAKVKPGYDKSDSLNKVCEEAYGKVDSDFQTAPANDKFTKEEVWKYCSIGGAQPQTIKEFNTGKSNEGDKEKYDDGKIGNDTSEQDKLLSVKNPDNDWIWDLKDKEFRGATIDTEGYFKTEKDKTGAEKKTLKEICRGAYDQRPISAEGGTKLEKTDVTKYCSLEQIVAS